MGYFVYIVRCADKTLYCGVTSDVERRLHEHNASSKASRYTRSRRPIILVFQKKCKDRSFALQYEAYIKSLTKKEKEKLVKDCKHN